MSNIKVQVSCIAIKDNRIAMIKKVNSLYATYNKLIPPGGHVESYENLEDACKREVLEETGLIVDNLKLHGVVTFRNRFKDYHSVCFFFIAESVEGKISTKEPEKQTSHWLNLDNLLNSESVPNYHKALLDEIIFKKNFVKAQIDWNLPKNEGLYWTITNNKQNTITSED